jgi:pimeloyl-ACP methyl ester carboxylesterase
MAPDTTFPTATSTVPEMPEAAALPIWHESLAALDWVALRLSPVYAGAGIPRGDGAPVVLVPGFMASDASMFELHRWLRRIGYAPYESGIGRNTQCPETHIARLLETVERAHRETGRRVTIIGHSLGGCFARGAALKRPDLVTQVISLGSPVQGAAVHPLIIAAAQFLRGDCTHDCYEHLQDPLPAGVRETCIFTKDDGIVDWHTCTRAAGAASIEVRGTHCGLIVNPNVYRALATLLASRHSAPAPPRSPRHRRTTDPHAEQRVSPLRHAA